VPATAPLVFSADDGCDVGRDTGAPVAEDYDPGDNAFNGDVLGVLISIDPKQSYDRLVTAEEALKVAMARQ
jgi:arylsulfatase